MPALNFMIDWADAVAYGARLAAGQTVTPLTGYPPKRTTIRKAGRAKPGDMLYLYTGQRTKACRKLGEALCLAVTPIYVARERVSQTPYIRLGAPRPGKELISGVAFERFARLDTAGLWDADRFIAFFADAYGLPFDGELICW